MNFEQARYANIFATPLITHHLTDAAELNAALRSSILAHQSASAGLSKSNRGGWHSEVGKLEFCGDAGQRLVSYMREFGVEATRRFFAEYRARMVPMEWEVFAWANVNRAGDFNDMHMHPSSTWSGTYYVDNGDPTDDAAPLHLCDPCQARTVNFFPPVHQASVYVHPKPGLIVLFPSYVPHMVLPHEGTGPRISIAFNLRRDPYP
jgi:uncharacterized protein (TIGR02466 family)